MTESKPNDTRQRIPYSALVWNESAVYDEHGGDCHATRQPRHEGHARKSQKKKRAAHTHNAQAQSHTIYRLTIQEVKSVDKARHRWYIREITKRMRETEDEVLLEFIKRVLERGLLDKAL